MIKLKLIPKFKTEAEEKKFWASHDSTEYVDWSKAEKAIFPNLSRTMKMFLSERVNQETTPLAK